MTCVDNTQHTLYDKQVVCFAHSCLVGRELHHGRVLGDQLQDLLCFFNSIAACAHYQTYANISAHASKVRSCFLALLQPRPVLTVTPVYLLQVQVIVVDEIGNAKEVAAIKDIASRGVTMVATVHGTSLQHLLENPVLSPLVGGKQRMVIGDFAAAQ